MAQPVAPSFFQGDSVAGVSPTLLASIEAAVRAAGGSGVYVISGKRPPGPGNDVKNSNHITGDAIDGYAIIGGKQVPLGQAIVSNAGKFGLRSGDQAGFDPKTPGGYDPDHVDDGANVGGVKPYSSTPLTVNPVATQLAPAAPAAAPTSSLAGQLRQQLGKFPGLDPNAVLAVSSTEGLSGGIGDGGHAFGPFQLNNAGGVLTGMFAGQSPEQIQAWASSPAGIDWGLSHIAKVARGLHGQQAINAIVTQFERPANIPHEIAGATAAYGNLPTYTAPANPVATQLAGSPAGTAPGSAPSTTAGGVMPQAPAKPALPLKLALQLLGLHPPGAA